MNDVMRKLIERTRGRKTYAAVVVGLVYLIGSWLKWWEYDSELVNAILLAGLAALRSGVEARKE